jgi:hypothetical protein
VPVGAGVGGGLTGGLSRRLPEDLSHIVILVLMPAPALALAGVVLRLPVIDWVILTPVFGVISVAEGWGHFANRPARLGLMWRLALDWCAALLSIYLLFNGGVQGVLNANATSLAIVDAWRGMAWHGRSRTGPGSTSGRSSR